MFAARVDSNLQNFGWNRSQMSQIQKAVCDQIIADHHGISTIDDVCKIIRTNLNSLKAV